MRRRESIQTRWSVTIASRQAVQALFALEPLETRLALSASVLTFHNDITSSGVNPNETQLSPVNVKVGTFGKLYTTPLDGQVYAQPLIDPGVNITTGINTTTGAEGTHDVAYVATEHDSIYAIDSTINGGNVLWKRSFTSLTAGYVGTTVGSNINNTLSATLIQAVPSGDTGSDNVSPEVGITGTPVIDPATNTMYVLVKTRETIGGVLHYIQRLHAINLTDGTDRSQPYVIGNTTGTNTNTTPIYVYGTGDGNVVDPYNATGKRVVQFNALREHHRGAISLVGSSIYVQWASHGDNGPYHGWVVKWDISNITTTGFQLKGALNTSPNNGLSGIWGGGGRLSFEPDGSAFYFETGNGSGGNPVLGANGLPTSANYTESVVKVTNDPATTPTSQNPNGWGMKVVDFFTPYNTAALDAADQDFGSGSPIVLPDSAGIPGHPHLLLASGKEGKIYLIDRDNLGKFDPGNDHVLNAVPDGAGHSTPPVQLGGSLSTPAYFNGKIYWVSGYGSTANAYIINSNGTLTRTSNTAVGTFGYLPGSPSISANGITGGIVWIPDLNANQIHAYDASTFATELWNTAQKPGGADSVGALIKFAVPTEANGELYVGTSNSLVVYGLTPPANSVPNAPVLSGTVLSGSSISLSWTDSTKVPNMATGYTIEQLIGGTYQQVTTAAAGSTTIAIGGLLPLTTYSFRIRGFNGIGNSLYANVVTLTTTNQIAALDFAGGFTGSTTKLTYNGTAAITNNRAELTNGGGAQSGSFFSTTPLDISKFDTSFTFQLINPNADGLTFTIQGNGPTAIGGGGGGLAYQGMLKSIGVKFDLYNNNGEGINSTGLYINGAPPYTPSIDLTPSGIDLHSGDVFKTNLHYDGTTLGLIITDSLTNQTFSQNFTINIPASTGTSAYVGFTGATGGATATQDILSWTFSPNAPAAPAAPTGLGATPANATSINLNWTNNATNQTGFLLDRATDSGFTQNLITQSLPATPSSFTDTATGLAPGGTFYYRIRALNVAGSSANSAPAAVTIPIAPAKPDGARATNVTTNQIDLTWNDNAGRTANGYRILRALNHGAFTIYATLPAVNSTGNTPTPYLWSDINLLPGTFYEYHIQAFNTSGNNDFTGTGTSTLTVAPSSLTAVPSTNSTTGSVALSWTAPTGAVGYNIHRGTTSGTETLLASGVLSTTYTDATAVIGVTYYYKVTAVNGNLAPLPSESTPSNEASATPTFPGSIVGNGTNADYIYLESDGAGNLDWWIRTTPFTVNPLGAIAPTGSETIASDTGLIVSGGGGIDSVTLNFSHGNFLQPTGISFANAASTGSTLSVIGTAGNDRLVIDPTSAGSIVGSYFQTDLSTFGNNAPIPLTNLGPAGFDTVNLIGGSVYPSSAGQDVVDIESGTLNVNADTPTGKPNVSVTIGTGAVAKFNSDQHVATLTINGGVARLSTTQHSLFLNGLSISGTGLLDIASSFLYLDRTDASAAAVRGYLNAGYNLLGVGNPNAPLAGDYNGLGGITSSIAKTSYAKDLVVGIGYYDGSMQVATNPDNVGQILGPLSDSGRGVGIPLNQILIRPTLTGDLNGDGVVNAYDIALLNSFGLFNAGPTPLGWQAGDLNGDGVVDAKDVTIFNTVGNFNNGAFPPVAPAPAAAMRTATASAATPTHGITPAVVRLKAAHQGAKHAARTKAPVFSQNRKRRI